MLLPPRRKNHPESHAERMRNETGSRLKVVQVVKQYSKRAGKGVYVRDRCPTCGNQAHCKRLSDLRAWCGNCQQGFAR